VAFIRLNVTQAQANATFEPFFAFARGLVSHGLVVSTAETTPFPSYYSWYKALFGSQQQGIVFAIEMALRLVNRDVIERDPQAVADAVIASGEAEWMYVSFNLLLLLAPLTLLTYHFCSLVAGGCTESGPKRDGRKSRLAYGARLGHDMARRHILKQDQSTESRN
jgi:hypothetical protein